jgi:hypothetical protein
VQGPTSSTSSRSGPAPIQQSATQASRPVVLALVIHAAADGLAVGVAHMSDSIRLAVAIGMAMVLHKGPVAFGLVSYLLTRNCPLSTIWQVLHLTLPYSSLTPPFFHAPRKPSFLCLVFAFLDTLPPAVNNLACIVLCYLTIVCCIVQLVCALILAILPCFQLSKVTTLSFVAGASMALVNDHQVQISVTHGHFYLRS